MIRYPYCDNWYPQTIEEIRTYFPVEIERSQAQVVLAIVPHAGWIYSGKIAGKVYASFPKVDTVIFTATNHTGLGPGCSVFPEGSWETPWGAIPVDTDFSENLLKVSQTIKPDTSAHLYEHAIEVQLPFLPMINPNVKIVPIEIRDYRWETCKEAGTAIAKVIREMNHKHPKNKYAFAASSDMTHCGMNYGQMPPSGMMADAFARSQDSLALKPILNLDPENFLKTIKEHNITACGPGAIAVVLQTAKELGKQKARLIAYGTSADMAGKNSELAVGYAGVLIE